MFQIYDGREHFYQWDLNQKLIIFDPSITEVHFCNKTDECALVCEVYDSGDLRLVNVPNVLFQEDWRIKVWAYCGDYTKHEATFKVIGRTKPADYVYTETEVKSLEALEAKVEAIVVPTKVSELENDKGYIENDGEDCTISAYAVDIGANFLTIKGNTELSIDGDNKITVNNNRIQEVATPEANTDAVNKQYVDNKKLSEFENDAGYIAPTNSGYNLDLSAYSVNLSGYETYISGDYVYISGIAEPTNADDAVNKGYVDNITGDINAALEAIIATQNSYTGGAE